MMAKRVLLFLVHEKTDTTGLEEFHPYQRHKIRCGEYLFFFDWELCITIYE